MSVDVNTELGTLRHCKSADDADIWLLWCPVCEDWERLNVEQFEGRLSVNHAATGCASGYHETHNFAVEVAARIGAWRFAPYGECPIVIDAAPVENRGK